jgi:hypothetical protein
MVPNVPWHRAPRHERMRGPPPWGAPRADRTIDASGKAEYLSVVSRARKRSKRYDDSTWSYEDEVRQTGWSIQVSCWNSSGCHWSTTVISTEDNRRVQPRARCVRSYYRFQRVLPNWHRLIHLIYRQTNSLMGWSNSLSLRRQGDAILIAPWPCWCSIHGGFA